MAPASGRSVPASWPMNVVFPAPFGPMTACVSPSRTSKSMPSLARSAPKVFTTPRTSSIVLLQHSGEAALEENDRENQERPKHDLPVLRNPGPRRALEDLLEREERK